MRTRARIRSTSPFGIAKPYRLSQTGIQRDLRARKRPGNTEAILDSICGFCERFSIDSSRSSVSGCFMVLFQSCR